jgi:hypothetical protein
VKDDIDALMRVAQRISNGETLSTELMGEEGVPTALRLVIAAVALTAADQPVSKKALTTAAPAARSASYRDHAELLSDAKEFLPALVQAQLKIVGVTVTATGLAEQLENANRIIREERVHREYLENQLEHVLAYARELHWHLRPERDEILREKRDKVRLLRSVPASDTNDVDGNQDEL